MTPDATIVVLAAALSAPLVWGVRSVARARAESR